jgi:hypothetical protein
MEACYHGSEMSNRTNRCAASIGVGNNNLTEVIGGIRLVKPIDSTTKESSAK